METNEKAKVLRKLGKTFAVSPYVAGVVLGFGRHRVKEAIKRGEIPVNDHGQVLVDYLERQLEPTRRKNSAA